MKSVLVLAVVTLAACSEVTAPPTTLTPKHASAAVLQNVSTPFEGIVIGCNGEVIDVSGETHDMMRVTTSSSDNLNVAITTTTHYSGIGETTGGKYEGGDRFKWSLKAGSDVPTIFTQRLSTKLVGQGKIPDMWLDLDMRFTVSGDGEMTREMVSYSSRCD